MLTRLIGDDKIIKLRFIQKERRRAENHMGKVQEHERQLLDKLKTVGRLSLTDAINLLNVSESTARRLFIRLEKDGHVIRNYGGIQYFCEPNMNYSFDQLESQNVAQKQAIAAYAVLLVENNDTIYIDSGTTLSHFSALLNTRIDTDALQNVTIFTNSLINLNTLQKQAHLHLIGGEYRQNRKDFCGYLTEETLKSLRFTKCFLGSDGYRPSFGFTTTDFHTARLNEIVLKNSQQSFVLMDSSKFDTSALVSYTRLHTVGLLITDRELPDQIQDSLALQGTAVHICDAP